MPFYYVFYRLKDNWEITRTLLVICFFSIYPFVMANSVEQKTKITIKAKNIPVNEIIKQIEKQSDYLFVYNDRVKLHKKISINVDSVYVAEALDILFSNSDIVYVIEGKNILLIDKDVIKEREKKTIQGVITDEHGFPVIGANIVELGSNNGTISDLDGNFIIKVQENATLNITFIGYVEKRVKVGTNSKLSIVLSEDIKKLDEVVVVGYGIQKKVNLTGAVELVKSNRIEHKVVTNLSSALVGEASGVTIVQNSGQPGNNSEIIRIRGVGTWGDASPLVLVDGIAMDIDEVAPSDVESVSILKDAASAAIYGSRAANGVILITTKRGKSGRVLLKYNGNLGFQTPTRTPKLAQSWQYAELYNRGFETEGKTSSLFPQDKIERMKKGGNPDVNEANVDWYDEFLKDVAFIQSHTVSINGGSERFSFLGSLGYTEQQGIIPNTEYNRYNMRLNATTKITDWMNIQANLSYVRHHDDEPSMGAVFAFQRVGRALPYMPVKYSDGTWSYASAPTNPVRMVTQDYGMRRQDRNNISLLISPEINPLPGLIIKGVFGYESHTLKDKKFDKIVDYEAFEPAGQEQTNVSPRNKQTDTWNGYEHMTASATMDYERTHNKHYFKMLVGASAESSDWCYTTAGRYDFPNNEFTEIDAGDSSTSWSNGNSIYSALVSLFGRINYSYNDRYLFEFNLRYDGSSKFARGHRFGLFPSFSVGWRISEEKFFENLKEYIPQMKLRTSWGKLGNQQIADFQYYSTFGAGLNYLFDTIQTSYNEIAMGNQNITWETSTSFNIGLDLALLSNRFQATFDWYKRYTDDILLNLVAPSTLGISAPLQNAGSVANKGWEVSLSWRDKIGKDLDYSIGINLSDVKNRVMDLKGYKSPTGNLTTRIEGEPIDAIFGWETLGICTTDAQYEKYKNVMHTYNPNWNIGDIIIVDRDNNGVINSDDKTVIGNQIPRYTFGLNWGIEYKNFDISCFFQGVGKADGYVTEEMLRPLGVYSALEDHYYKSFNPEKPSADAYYPRPAISWTYNYGYMEHWVQNAAYIRLKNMTLGYTFKLPKYKIQSLRLSLSGENLLTFSKFHVWDPETSVGAMSTYPQVSIYSFGVNVTF